MYCRKKDVINIQKDVNKIQQISNDPLYVSQNGWWADAESKIQATSLPKSVNQWTGGMGGFKYIRNLNDKKIITKIRTVLPMDKLGIINNYIVKNGNRYVYKSTNRLRYSDINSVKNISLINQHFPFQDKETIYILDIGGGYGRLTEAIFNLFHNVGNVKIKYVLLDTTPLSLTYALSYLKQNLPNIKICDIWDDKSFDFDEFDLIVTDYGNFMDKNKYEFDICINIESFQEMALETVDNYLNLINNVCAPNGIIYVDNSLNWRCKFTYNFPPNWEVLYNEQNPFSYTTKHPMIVAKKNNNSPNEGYQYAISQE